MSSRPAQLPQATAYTMDSVTDNHTGLSSPMVVKEYNEIGKGAFGTVVQAKLKFDSAPDTPDSWYGPFAIKRVPAQTEYKSRELETLRAVNHPNVIQLKYFFDKLDPRDNIVYQNLVMECLPSTLQIEIKNYRVHQLILPLSHIKVYSYQIARAMMYLHAQGICHRDIKPSNILIDPKTLVLKICDFGSAKKLEPNAPSVSYICSRFYRAPELIVGCQIYSTKIDIWGLGCVIAEMFLGRAIFQGEDPYLQLREISKLLGPPGKEFVYRSNPGYDGPTYSTKLFSSSIPTRFAKVFNNASTDAVDLLMHVLVYEPELRPTPRRIMCHQFFDDLKNREFRVRPRNRTDELSVEHLFRFSDYELQVLGSLTSHLQLY
ncbi:hypothetical protein BABINDRAFT_137420 [Babjeviella inositovora NRRL Y-12698]|uniref:Protein kinase domain-containing protein n=1 Tax=Babjeviella inositovora NRRL Y-12698 TaxID=984486 RepID=A0A1E3QR11_9ASCO|nr:uncharacterized protein BABINDRAFT_137420 [Babjeviella inositovora NRRL Y-12698]ODQ79924.1 hypothetical protein BABINDRAFT_137420 [Babjeviella inositovora NRRL Y-12698]